MNRLIFPKKPTILLQIWNLSVVEEQFLKKVSIILKKISSQSEERKFFTELFDHL
jgi:hypothetical protein